MQITTEQLFNDARSTPGYTARAVPESTLRALYDLMKWGPTAFNCTPARLAFVQSAEAKAKLLACVSPGNVRKITEAPVTVVVGMDLAFPEQLPVLYPAMDARAVYAGKPELTFTTALRNSSLQGGYLIMAARALGLDCGPMSGFDPTKVDAAFWAGTQVKTNFLCTLGQGDATQLRPRGPRLAFEEACRLL